MSLFYLKKEFKLFSYTDFMLIVQYTKLQYTKITKVQYTKVQYTKIIEIFL